MVEALLLFLMIGVVIVGIFAQPGLLRQRRNRLKRRPFPPHWAALMDHCLPMYLHLSPDERRQLQGHVQVFLAEKQFIGCAGLQVTEEMKVTIAAIACLLLLNGREHYFPKLRSILLYPSAYWATEKTSSDGYIVEEQRVARLGESWSRDQVVLAWEQIRRDVQNWKDGHNVVLHEFAHQLDQEDGNAEGVPVLPTQADYLNWSQVMTQEYQRLCNQVHQGSMTVLDPYGATHPTEFFAVATETFFEKPDQLRKHHPDLYEQLRRYYRLEPMQWA